MWRPWPWRRFLGVRTTHLKTAKGKRQENLRPLAALPSEGNAASGSPRRLRLARLHLVADGLLGPGDPLGRAALRRDLLLRRLGEMVRPYGQVLGHLAAAEDAYAIGRSLGQSHFAQRLGVHRGAGVERLVQVA